MCHTCHSSSFTFTLLVITLPSIAVGQFSTTNISYVMPTIPQANSLGWSAVVADFNHDGYPDIAAALGTAQTFQAQPSTFVVMLGNGRGAFRPLNPVPLPNNPCQNISCSLNELIAGDFNGDGNQDLIFSGTYTSGATTTYIHLLYPGNGDGTFQPAVDISKYAGTFLSVTSLRGNGKPDLLSLSHIPGELEIALGNGDGTFQDPVELDASGTTCNGSFAAGDLGNGHVDIVCAYGGTGYEVFLGNGDGTFQPAVTYPDVFPSGLYGSAIDGIHLGHFNSNHKIGMTVVVDLNGSPDTFEIMALNGKGDGTFEPPTRAVDFGGDSAPTTVLLGDINRDGLDDLAFTVHSYDSPSQPGWALSKGDGTFSPPAYLNIANEDCDAGSNFPPYDYLVEALADLTGSGWIDGLEMYQGSDCMPLLFNNGNSQVATTTNLTSSSPVQYFPNPVTFTATVTGNEPPKQGGPTVPPGGVDLYNGNTLLARRPLISGSATFDNVVLPTIPLNLTAVYSGNSKYFSSSSVPLEQVILGADTSLTLTVTPASGSSLFSVPLTLQATATGQFTLRGQTVVPWGVVNFYANNKLIAARALNNGIASLTYNALPIGVNNLTASYPGNSQFSAAYSEVVTQTVNGIPTSIALASTPNPSTAGSPVTFSATISHAAAPDPAQPNGYLFFYDGATKLGAARIVSGVASFTISTLSAGNHSITANYASGSTAYAPSTSDAVTQQVH